MAEPKDGGRYIIVTATGSFALSDTSKITLSAYADEAKPNQIWKLSQLGVDDDKHVLFKISSATTGNHITLRYAGVFDDKIAVSLQKNSPATAQQWYFEAVDQAGGTPSYRIYSSLAMNLCLPDDAIEGTEIYTWIRDNSEKSSFYLVEA